jgi:hypothetical protein
MPKDLKHSNKLGMKCCLHVNSYKHSNSANYVVYDEFNSRNSRHLYWFELFGSASDRPPCNQKRFISEAYRASKVIL